MHSKSQSRVRQLTIAGLLIALGLIIPQIMPKIVIGPASFTLASHVPIFIAIFFGVKMAVAVNIGVTVGFFMSTSPVIAARALSQVIFIIIACYYLEKKPEVLIGEDGKLNWRSGKFQWFNFWIGLIHSLCEVIVIAVFHFSGASVSQEAISTVLLITAVGCVLHSMIDFVIACFIVERLSNFIEFPLIEKY